MLEKISEAHARKLYTDGILIYISFPYMPTMDFMNPFHLLIPDRNFDQEVASFSYNRPVCRGDCKVLFFTDSHLDLIPAQISIEELFSRKKHSI